MKKETVTLKNVKRDIIRSCLNERSYMSEKVLLSVFFLSVGCGSAAYYRHTAPTEKGRLAGLILLIVFAAALTAIFIRLGCVFIAAFGRCRNFKVTKQVLHASTLLETDHVYHPRRSRTEPILERIAYFDAGKWLVPLICFGWSKANKCWRGDLFEKIGEGSDFYVLYGKDKTVYYAYPADLFELSEEVSNFERLREEKRERRRRY